MKTLVLFYSTYGHIFKMAEAVAEGASGVEGTEATLMRVPETLPEEVLGKMGALEAQKAFAHVPIATPDDLAAADAIAFGTPTRFGNMAAQMKAFIDSLGGLWMKGALIGKPAGVFTSSGTQHGGQESTILTFHPVLMHLGMIIVGLPYSFTGQTGVDEVKGGSPYGASTIAGPDGSRFPSKVELEGAKEQGRLLAEVSKKLRA